MTGFELTSRTVVDTHAILPGFVARHIKIRQVRQQGFGQPSLLFAVKRVIDHVFGR